MANQKLVLSNRATETLRDAIATPGWITPADSSNAVKLIYQGGQILVEVLPTIKDRPPIADPKAPTEAEAKSMVKWADTKAAPFELSGPHLDIAKKAVTFLAEKDALQRSKYTNELFKALGMVE